MAKQGRKEFRWRGVVYPQKVDNFPENIFFRRRSRSFNCRVLSLLPFPAENIGQGREGRRDGGRRKTTPIKSKIHRNFLRRQRKKRKQISYSQRLFSLPIFGGKIVSRVNFFVRKENSRHQCASHKNDRYFHKKERRIKSNTCFAQVWATKSCLNMYLFISPPLQNYCDQYQGDSSGRDGPWLLAEPENLQYMGKNIAFSHTKLFPKY